MYIFIRNFIILWLFNSHSNSMSSRALTSPSSRLPRWPSTYPKTDSKTSYYVSEEKEREEGRERERRKRERERETATAYAPSVSYNGSYCHLWSHIHVQQIISIFRWEISSETVAPPWSQRIRLHQCQLHWREWIIKEAWIRKLIYKFSHLRYHTNPQKNIALASSNNIIACSASLAGYGAMCLHSHCATIPCLCCIVRHCIVCQLWIHVQRVCCQGFVQCHACIMAIVGI